MNLCECSGGWLYGWFIHQRRDIHIQNWAGYLLGKIIGEGLIEIRFSFATVDSYDIYFMKYHSWISIFISPSFSNLKIDSHWLNKKYSHQYSHWLNHRMLAMRHARPHLEAGRLLGRRRRPARGRRNVRRSFAERRAVMVRLVFPWKTGQDGAPKIAKLFYKWLNSMVYGRYNYS